MTYSDIIGTSLHENRKEQMKQYGAKIFSNIKGTPEHENRKKQMKQYSAENYSYSDTIGSPLHKQRKEQMRSFLARKEQRERNKCAKQSSKASENVDKIETFKNEIQKGPLLYMYCV